MKETNNFNTPILFMIFNRPERALQVFNEIKKQKPKILFVHADGPRADNKNDIENCKISREIIETKIDWECDLHTLFRNENMGCKLGPASAISWFFENVEAGIILEDDCLPHPDFFKFCSTMLQKYQNEPKIMSIAGSNFQNGIKRDKGSYYFSIHNRIWGWATWKRTWSEYHVDLENINNENFEIITKKMFSKKRERKYWNGLFNYVKENKSYDAWDYPFMFMLWMHNGLTVVPNVNLITNIGDGEDATHTNWINNPNLYRTTNPILPIIENNKIKRNRKADEYYFNHFILIKKKLITRIFNKILKLKKKLFLYLYK